MKKIFITVLLMIGIVIMGASAMVIDKGEPFHKEEMTKEEIRNKELETYKTTQFNNNTVFVRTRFNITTKDELIRYKKNRIETLINLSQNLLPETHVNAVITFKDKLSTEEYSSFVKMYKLKAVNYMYSSYPEGTGVFSSDVPGEAIVATEKEMKKNMGENFKLIDQISSVKTQIPIKDLMKIQNDPRIFLVDVGPGEIYTENQNKAIHISMDYLYPIYSKVWR